MNRTNSNDLLLSQVFASSDKRGASGGVSIWARVKPVDNGEQSIFTGDEENGKSVVATRVGLKSRIAQTQYKNDSNLEKINDIFPDKPDVFYFDGAFSHKTNQETFFRKTVKESIARIVNGENSTILIHGPSRCGKTYSLTGAEKQQKGIMFRCVDELIARIETANEQGGTSLEVNVSIFAVYNNEILDLLADSNSDDYHEIIENNANDITITGLSRQHMKYKSEYKSKYVSALKRIQALSQEYKEKKLYEKSHLVIQFILSEKECATFSKLNLIRLADVDLLPSSSDDFDVIFQYIQQLNQSNSTLTRAYKKSKLTQSIRDTLNERTHSQFITCINASSAHYSQSYKSLQYSSKLVNNNKSTNEYLSRSNSQKRIYPTNKPPFSPTSNNPHQNSNSNIRPLSASSNQLPPQYSQPSISSQPSQSNTQYIINEVENIFKDIRSQSRIFGRLPERDRLQWVAQKEGVLSDLARQLQEQPYSREVPYCESLLQKCQRQLQIIDPNVGDSKPLRSSPPRGASSLGRQGNQASSMTNLNEIRQNQSDRRQSDYQRRLSPSEENRHQDYEFLKDKEEKLDRDFSRLLDRYNHSKELIDTLSQPNANHSISQQHQQHPLQQSQSQINNLRQSYDPDNQRALFTRTSSKKRLSTSPQQQYELQQLDNVISPSSNNDESGEKNVGISLKKLKETIEMKENIEKSKIDKLRCMNKEYKISLQEYVARCEQLQDVLRQKDNQIEGFEYELRQSHEDIQLNVENIKEYKLKEQGWLQLEEELREANISLKSKLIKKKKKTSQQKEEWRRREEEFASQLQQFQSEHKQLQQFVQQQEGSQNEHSNKALTLKEEVTQYKRQLEQKEQELKQIQNSLEEANNANQQLTAKVLQEELHKSEQSNSSALVNRRKEELEEQVKILEQKVLKHKTRNEEERNKLIEERNAENNKKKEKIKLLKAQLTDTEDKLQDQEIKYQNILKQAEQLDNQLRETNQYYIQAKDERDSYQEQIQKLVEERNQINLENERLQNLVTASDEKINKYENSQIQDAKNISSLKQQLEDTSHTLLEREDELQKANEEIDIMKIQQEQSLSTIEEQLEKVVNEIAQQREENQEYKRKEIETKKHITNLDESLEKYKEKYLKQKHTNKNLQLHLKELEDKVKEFQSERSSEIQNMTREMEKKLQADQTQKNKLKFIQEIQSLVKNHKQNINKN